MKAPLPPNEEARLEKLREYDILDTAPEQAFDDITRLASQICGVPFALVSLIDRDRQWFKSRVGLEINETSRDVSFCAHAILAPGLTHVPDAALDPRFCDNPFVTGDPRIRFYAGAPLLTPDGQALGTLCVVDLFPRELSCEQQEALENLSRVVMTQLELRRLAAELRLSEERYRNAFEDSPLGLYRTTPDGRVLMANPALVRMLGYDCFEQVAALALESDAFHSDHPRARFKEILAREGMVQGLESSWRRRDGTRLFVRESARAVREPGGTVLYYEGTVEDITRQKEAEAALLQRERQLQTITDNVPVFIAQVDARRRYTFANKTYQDFLGVPVGRILGRSLWDVLGEAAYAVVRPYVDRALAGEAVTYEACVPFRGIGPRFLHLSYKPEFGPEGEVAGIMLSAMDITEGRRTEEALRHSEEHLQLALKAGRMGTWEIDYAAGTSTLSAGMEGLFGLPPGAFEGRFENFLKRVHPEDLPRILTLRAERETSYDLEFRILRPDGGVRWLASKGQRFFDAEGQPRRTTGAVVDITVPKALEAERERLLAEALERADHCPLTGLLNHRAFHRKLEEEADRALRAGTSLGVAMLDLNNFKFFNDVYGHQVGDDVLRQVAKTLQTTTRPYDTLARFGGDEFAVLMPDVGTDEAACVVARLRASVEGLGYRPPGHDSDIPLGVSLGLAVFPDEAAARQDAIALADQRLYRAKTGGDGDNEAELLRSRMSTSLEGFSMLDALVTAVDNKDRYTRKHSEDVMAYSLGIAREMDLDDDARHSIAVAALLHDVGKIGVPDFVLRKPGTLTDAEFGAMRQHPQMGAVIVGAVPGLEATLDAVRHHHERWDGDGYPFGLRGGETPLMARLMAVADAFSAMTTDRPYRKGRPPEEALAVLQDGAGAQWDPACVSAFLRSWSGLVSQR